MTSLPHISKAVVLLFTLVVHSTWADYGIFFNKKANTSSWQDHFCVMYNPLFQDLPLSMDKAPVHKMVDISHKYGCIAEDYTPSVRDAVVIVARGNCTFSERALLAQTAGAKVLIVAGSTLDVPGANNSTEYKNINITVATALMKDVHKYLDSKTNQVSALYQPVPSKWDPNMIVLFCLAVSNIAIGGFWAGITKHAKFMKLKYKHKREQPSANERRGSGDRETTTSDNDDDESVDVSLVAILIFFVFVCGFLLLLYFFYDYMVYVIIALFCIASSSGLFGCLMPLWHKILPWKARLPPNRIPVLADRPEFRDFILLAICLAVAIFWGIQRHEPYAWIIQDFLGYAFCLNVMKLVGIPNMKVCTIMLSLLFVYDIFFVFITPLFTENHESIMVEVATGRSSKTNEKLPMVFQVPRLTRDIISACPLSNSLLGFGDIIVPGLLVTHNHVFDLRVGSPRVYYIVSCVGYAIGLVITFIALALMETGQPALLYLVPCTLIPTFIVGCIRGEVKTLWRGPNKPKDEEIADSASSPSGNVTTTPAAVTNSADSISSGENESRGLLRH